MKTARLTALLVLLFVSTLAGLRISHAEEPKAAEAPAPKVPAFPGAADYTALRMAYAAQPGFSSYWNVEPERQAIFTAIAAFVRPGDEVLLPPYTFVATYNVVVLNHALPVFVDVDLGSNKTLQRALERPALRALPVDALLARLVRN